MTLYIQNKINNNDPKIAVIILNWNGKVDTLECLNSLHTVSYKNYQVVIVDNGSIDASASTFKANYPALTVIETGQNLGYAEGNNVGIRYALESGADYILLLNNDTTVAPDFLDQLGLAAQQNTKSGVFGAVLLYMNQPDTIWFAGARWNNETLAFDYPAQDQKLPSAIETETDYACGAALFFSVDVVHAIGLLDPRFFLSWEESDWCFRARSAGFPCKMVPNAYVWHKIGTSFGGETSPLREYFIARNRLLWAEKNLAPKDLIRQIFNSLNAFFPKFCVSRSVNEPFLKRLLWSVYGWKQTWLSLSLQAKRRGIIDYFLRNFGNCPESIRELNKQYAEQQK